MSARLTVLVIHALRPTSRQTTIDHLLAFREHLPNADVQYLHFAQPLPQEIAEGVSPDLLIVNYDYLNYRFSPLWPYIKNRHRNIARRSKKVVAIAQDDFWGHQLLDNWCMSWEVDRILTPIDNDLHVLYPRAIKHIDIRSVLTGYAPTVAPVVTPLAKRPIDLGQRVRAMPPHLGAYAQEKGNQTSEFAGFARAAGFTVDVSTKVEDSIVGDAWPQFLQQCKFTVGMKGGASIADPYGLLYNRVEARRHRRGSEHLTTSSFGFLRRRDEKHRFSAISPRLFEAAAAGTCQVLRPDNYLNALEPWVHYLPLNADFSNAGDVLAAMRNLDSCQAMVQTAAERLITSGEFGYHHLVRAVTDGLLAAGALHEHDSQWKSFSDFLLFASELCASGQIHLHDAAVQLIHSGLPTSGNSAHGAAETIHAQVIARGHQNWFNAMAELSRPDSLSWRSPWVWRPLR